MPPATWLAVPAAVSALACLLMLLQTGTAAAAVSSQLLLPPVDPESKLFSRMAGLVVPYGYPLEEHFVETVRVCGYSDRPGSTTPLERGTVRDSSRAWKAQQTHHVHFCEPRKMAYHTYHTQTKDVCHRWTATSCVCSGYLMGATLPILTASITTQSPRLLSNSP
jgi:hypothetical protein